MMLTRVSRAEEYVEHQSSKVYWQRVAEFPCHHTSLPKGAEQKLANLTYSESSRPDRHSLAKLTNPSPQIPDSGVLSCAVGTTGTCGRDIASTEVSRRGLPPLYGELTKYSLRR